MKQNETVVPQSSAELIDSYVPEFIMLGGKDGVGKSSALVSMARYVEIAQPDAQFFVVDSENKIKATLKSFGNDAPKNIVYFKCDTMNQITFSISTILEQHNPGDWLGVESMSRIWERAQNLGYEAIAGVSKIEYLERKVGEKMPTGVVKKNSPIPTPDEFWAVVKGAHDGAFFDLLTQQTDLNVIVTTTVAKPKQEREGRKENIDRKAVRVELGIDVGLEGAPRIPYYIQTLGLLDLVGGNVTCRLLRDNNSKLENGRVEFPVPDKKSWGFAFYENCRS